MSNHKSTESAIKNLEVQVGQLAKQLADRLSTSFGANTEKNPKEECNAIMTRIKLVTMNESENGIGAEKQQLVSNPSLDTMVESLSESEEELEVEDEKKETTIKLEITMPFGKALQQMQLYAKFLKDMLTRKNRYIHSDTIVVEGNCSAVIQCILPRKHSDPGSVTIPCSIGEVAVGKALIDLGANINLMPLSMCRRLGELEIMPTRMTLHLADRSISRPFRVIGDVLIQVKHRIFLADFLVMDIEEDLEIPIILGRPFISTASCIVDMGKGELELSVEDQKISFNLFEAMKHPNDQKACFDEEKVEREIELAAIAMVCIKELEGAGENAERHIVFEELKNSGQIEKPKLELKTLPTHLKYVFLEDNEAKLVIISSSLKKTKEDQLVQILKKHKAVIRWHISDLKGISPSYCMHKINMEADYKPVRQPQR
ncbi:uncharacterized protein [Glycine max]|uniref:uncharacterized protein n=1 Tax=Glycine max TaxID=3847 RepID=UPI0003DED46B|nr:uncharacterized protein LOC102666820 [Glycine max]|eukprot:XP_006577524.1 uncharacterized protein LOC102666820 [Glycine max]